MLNDFSIKALYSLALAEGEGVGTAYEYYAKRLMLRRRLTGWLPPRSVLVAGLPERYGSSLDFLLLAAEVGAEVTVVDDRPGALKRLAQLESQLHGRTQTLPLARPANLLATDLAHLPALQGRYELALSSEVLQRLSAAEQRAYVQRLGQLSGALAIFAPNAANDAHTTISGLAGVTHEALREIVAGELGDWEMEAGYLDMPPFPPGITRTGEQREQASTGRMEAAAMSLLRGYARAERLWPERLRQRHAHIVYLWAQAPAGLSPVL